MQETVFYFCFRILKMMLINNEIIQKINLIENLSKVKVKELIERDDKLIVIINENELIKIIKDKGKNIKNIERMMHTRIKVVEFNKDPLKFTKNYIYPIRPLKINLNDNIIEISVEDRKSKGLLIGRESKNLNELNNLIKKYYNLQAKVM